MKEALRPSSGSPIIGGGGDFGIVSTQSLRNALRDRGDGRLFGAARFVVSELSRRRRCSIRAVVVK